MKNSGLGWLGNVPADWKSDSFRHYVIRRDGGAWGENINEEDEGTICLRVADFDFSNGRFRTCDQEELTRRKYTDGQIARLTLLPGDILIEKSGGGEKTPVGRAVLFDKPYKALFANFLERIRVDTSRVDPEFVEYWLRAWFACRSSPYYINQTTGIQNISISLMLAKERLFCPDLFGQKSIINYLDFKCDEIDRIAADIEAEIKTLVEYRSSVICEAVTHGLERSAQMKESGARWCSSIPAHWEMVPSKYLFHDSDLRKQEGDEQLTASQKYGIITQQDYMEREGTSIVLANKGLEDWKHVEPYDFIISLRSFQGGLEMSEVTGCITWHYIVLKPSRPICHRYYKWLFKSAQYINALQGTCNFIRDGQDLRFSNFAQVPLFVPPMEEQEAIADYLDQKTVAIDAAIEEKTAQLTTLEEYKKSLIFEYVTGKKEVPA